MKNFCTLPFTEIFVSNGRARPCCNYSGSFPYDSYQSNEQILKIKKQLLNDELPSGCYRCKHKEELYGKSLRTTSLETNTIPIEQFNEDYFNLVRLTLDTGNVCNLLCLTCNGASSYVRGVELHKLKFTPVIPEPFADSNLHKFLNLNPVLLNITGGEPFGDKVTFEFLDQLVRLDKSKNVNLSITTNLTLVTEEKLDFLISNFKTVYIRGSIDGHGPVNNYLRYPSDWAVIESVVDLLLSKDVGFGITTALSNLSVLRYYELIQWAINKSIANNFAIAVTEPDVLLAGNLPADLKASLLKIYKELKDKYPDENHGIDICIDICSDQTDRTEEFKKTIEVCIKHDQLRKTNIFDVFPELKKYE